jgi:hypothetical protein
MNIENMKFAIEALRNIPEKAVFDMGEWGYHRGGHPLEKDNYCGTVACAAGWICIAADKHDRGIKLGWRGSRFWPVATDGAITGYTHTLTSWLDISVNQFNELFYPSFYLEQWQKTKILPKHVIAKMEKMLEGELAKGV